MGICDASPQNRFLLCNQSNITMSERKFKLSMLEYYKVILFKISFDKRLFWKEYKKAIKHLDEGERAALKNWVRSQWNMVTLMR